MATTGKKTAKGTVTLPKRPQVQSVVVGSEPRPLLGPHLSEPDSDPMPGSDPMP